MHSKFTKNIINIILITIGIQTFVHAQNAEDSVFKPSGKLWGLAYGDFAYKNNSDSLNRGGANQYTGIHQDYNLFQFRRIYLGYDYQVSPKFSTALLLASEENEYSTALKTPTNSGDLLQNGKIATFVKIADMKWKNIFKGSDLIIGQMFTPSCVMLTEAVWDYRCIERTISDLRRTPTYDMGISLNGRLVETQRSMVGYNLMVGNGTGSKPENNNFKWYYGDVYAKLFNKHLILDLYADYAKIDWTTTWHHDRSMIKGAIAYTAPKITVGVEAFYNSLMNDDIATTKTNKVDTITTTASAISVFVRGRIYTSKLGFFIRYDNYNPTMNNHNSIYEKYAPITSNYDPNTQEQFFTAGIDYSPINKIHIMPNVWYNAYNNAAPVVLYNSYDLVYRLSIYYVYGK